VEPIAAATAPAPSAPSSSAVAFRGRRCVVGQGGAASTITPRCASLLRGVENCPVVLEVNFARRLTCIAAYGFLIFERGPIPPRGRAAKSSSRNLP